MTSPPPQRLARNIELKARLDSFAQARQVAERLATDALGVELQIDTYFAGAEGRLKLRQREGRTDQLVWYARPNATDAKASDYRLVEVADAAALKEALAAAYGILIVVEKRREIFLHHNVRIHLDQVAGLGDFLEFEAVLGTGHDDADGRAALARLSQEFAIEPQRLVAGSYSDLLLVERASRG
ncbi:MAG TPA: class IV adenylate cyclase [Pirellulales bacterium]|jgi:predicted adenylyl cyclase CyaB|nr:class IV adenylate cyclase [Pirellulales bacterium]